MKSKAEEGVICRDCYEVGIPYSRLTNGQKRCTECGGVVLDLQEAGDYIAELKEQVRGMQEIYE